MQKKAPKTECGCIWAGKFKTVAYVYPPRQREIAKERKKEHFELGVNIFDVYLYLPITRKSTDRVNEIVWMIDASMDRIEYLPNIGQITLSDAYYQSIFL